MRGIIGYRSITCLIGACIVIGFVSQAQLSQKDEDLRYTNSEQPKRPNTLV
jgi:hypothetical protein